MKVVTKNGELGDRAADIAQGSDGY